MKNAYVVAEMQTIDFEGGNLVQPGFEENYLVDLVATLREKYPDYTWRAVTVNRLYETVPPEEEGLMIALAKNATDRQAQFQQDFPTAKVAPATEF